jgi:hypothetical protein
MDHGSSAVIPTAEEDGMKPMNRRFVYVVVERGSIVSGREACECPSFWHTEVTAANEDEAYDVGQRAYDAAPDKLDTFANDYVIAV